MRLFSMYSWVKERHIIDMRRRTFIEAPYSGGIVLLVCVAVAMLLANLDATKELYHQFLRTDLTLTVHTPNNFINWVFPRGMTVELFVNDLLMVLFFFSVGLEIKREVMIGHLRELKRATLPIVGAVGGMVLPALIYLTLNHGTASESGWGIPMATDIAFAIAILSMLGRRVPITLKIFLTALAIVDDLGAILVIAIFYGGTIKLTYLALAGAIVALLYLLNRLGEKRLAVYIIPSLIVWALFYYSGVHATIAGVLVAFVIPMRPRYSKAYFTHKLDTLREGLLGAEHKGEDWEFPNEEHRHYLQRITDLARSSVGLSYRLEKSLALFVTFFIMPIFALANAGVEFSTLNYLNVFHHSSEVGVVGAGVLFGLVIGKPLGVFVASWIAVKLGWAKLPEGSSWRMLFAVATLAGIGFTMSIFVDSIAFSQIELINRGKIAILMGSFISAILGCILIMLFSKDKSVKI